ncbi:hypothetical protein D6Y11_15140 [Vibrio parahaemolyticus]|nr:hypothetical protein [Vibrio parahaemolyticus]
MRIKQSDKPKEKESLTQRISSKTHPAYNAFYTANSGFSRTLPHSFLTKEKQILALTFMKQIEK